MTASNRIDIKAILRDPKQRRRLLSGAADFINGLHKCRLPLIPSEPGGAVADERSSVPFSEFTRIIDNVMEHYSKLCSKIEDANRELARCGMRVVPPLPLQVEGMEVRKSDDSRKAYAPIDGPPFNPGQAV